MTSPCSSAATGRPSSRRLCFSFCAHRLIATECIVSPCSALLRPVHTGITIAAQPSGNRVPAKCSEPSSDRDCGADRDLRSQLVKEMLVTKRLQNFSGLEMGRLKMEELFLHSLSPVHMTADA